MKRLVKMLVLLLEGGIVLLYFAYVFMLLYFLMSGIDAGFPSKADVLAAGVAFSWIGLVKVIAAIFFFFLLPPLALFSMVELLVLQGKAEEVSWVTLLCFVGALCLQLKAFVLAFSGRGFWAFFSGLLVTALVWGRLRVVRANAARARQGRAAMAFQVALRNLILLTD